MKTVLETSLYAILLAIICFISTDLIIMNMRVSQVNEDTKYIESFIEAYGKGETDNGQVIYAWYQVDENGDIVYETKKVNEKDVTVPVTVFKSTISNTAYESQYRTYLNNTVSDAGIRSTLSTKGTPVLDSDLLASLQAKLKKNGITLNIKYLDETSNYTYIEYTAKYRLAGGFIKFKSNKTYTGIARFTAQKDIVESTTVSTIYNGVDYSSVYNFNYYIAHNDEVKSMFENNPADALKYFVEYGMAAGQQASEEFNVYVYMNKYPDLRTEFNEDLKRYYIHYRDYGKAEGRTGTEGE